MAPATATAAKVVSMVMALCYSMNENKNNLSEAHNTEHNM
jgi:hypothetical protein